MKHFDDTEQRRLRALARYDVLDTPPEEAFETILQIAVRLFQMPIVLITLVAETHQWFKACYGLDIRQTSRDVSFCTHAILGSEVMVVEDATRDPRFVENPLVTGEPFIRFYAGAPLRTPDGYNLGTLCIIDRTPKADFNIEQRETLQRLADLVMDEFELRHKAYELQAQIAFQRHVESELLENQQELKLLEAAVANTSESIIITEASPIDEPGPRIVYVNDAFTKATGYSASEAIGRSPRFLQGDKTDRSELRRIRDALKTQSPVHAEIINYRKDGSEFHVGMHLAPVKDHLGNVSHFVAIQSDITQRKQQELLSEYRREIFELIAMQATLANIMTRLITLFEMNNPGLMVAVHYRRADHLALAHAPSLPECFRGNFNHLPFDAPGTDIYRLVHGREMLVITDILSHRQWRRYHRAARETAIQSCWSQPIINEANHVCGAISILSKEVREPTVQEYDLLIEVSHLASIAMSQRRLLAQLEHQALYDTVTGLGNRKYMRDRLQQRLITVTQPQKFAVVVLDIDNFRDINDSFGRAVGDTLLHNVATRLKTLLAPHDVLTRLHGDEFGLILGFTDQSELESILRAIEQSLSQTFVTRDSLIDITVSMGISLYPDDGQTADELLMFADGALHATKAGGKRGYRYYHPSILAQLSEQLELSRDLKRALLEGKLTLFYQPRADAATHQTVAAEALIRWHHPTRGFLPPAAFLSVAEKAGLMPQLDMWVLQSVCEQLRNWQQMQLPYRLSCNISAASFNDEAFAERVIALLDEMQIDPDKLELEITEDMLLKNPEQAASQLTTLKTACPGLHIAIDDFGTGHSSLAYLRYLPVDTLKIDRLFVRDLDSDQQKTRETAQAVINTVVLLGHQLNLAVVAEGTETMAQIETLTELGCDEIQGYAYGRPMPLQDFLNHYSELPPLSSSTRLNLVSEPKT
jgi:diguanylate cyclase (GGDEF)-like protein/PAS domain S-box-containing protein